MIVECLKKKPKTAEAFLNDIDWLLGKFEESQNTVPHDTDISTVTSVNQDIQITLSNQIAASNSQSSTAATNSEASTCISEKNHNHDSDSSATNIQDYCETFITYDNHLSCNQDCTGDSAKLVSNNDDHVSGNQDCTGISAKLVSSIQGNEYGSDNQNCDEGSVIVTSSIQDSGKTSNIDSYEIQNYALDSQDNVKGFANHPDGSSLRASGTTHNCQVIASASDKYHNPSSNIQNYDGDSVSLASNIQNQCKESTPVSSEIICEHRSDNLGDDGFIALHHCEMSPSVISNKKCYHASENQNYVKAETILKSNIEHQPIPSTSFVCDKHNDSTSYKWDQAEESSSFNSEKNNGHASLTKEIQDHPETSTFNTPNKKGSLACYNLDYCKATATSASTSKYEYLSDFNDELSLADSTQDPDFQLTDSGVEESDGNESIIIPMLNDCNEFYIPNSCSSEYESAEEVQPQIHENIQSKIHMQKKTKIKEGCKQVYDKINYCIFCQKGIRSKISRHLLSVHSGEFRVQAIRHLAKRSKERMMELEILVNEGNFIHNTKVMEKGEGEIVVGRRGQKCDVKKYLPCEYCKKFMLKSSLWLHNKTCSIKQLFMGKSTTSGVNAVRRGRNLLHSAMLKKQSKYILEMLKRMHDDELKDVVVNDHLIKRYSSLKIEALGRKELQKPNDIHRISQAARTLARLVLEARKAKPTCMLYLDSLIKPEHFDLVVNCTKKLSHDKEKPVPSLGRYLGNLLGHMTVVKIGDALRTQSEMRNKEATEFQKLFEAEWTLRINSICTKQINFDRRNKVKTIPVTEDLVKLRSHIMTNMHLKMEAVKNDTHPDDWQDLAKLTMSRLILFNKRRQAEVQNLKVNDFLSRPDWSKDVNGEFELALSQTDKLLLQRMDMVISSGKSRKNVDAYVLLPPDCKNAITLLIETRSAVGVPLLNPFLFARINANTPLCGYVELQKIAQDTPGLEFPERINSNSLRKYIATVSQILDMNEKEIEMMATHLGHDVKTHKEYYRLSHSSVELSKVSQILMAVDSGEVNKWKGKSLSEIEIDDLAEEDPEIEGSVDTQDQQEYVDEFSVESASEPIIHNLQEKEEKKSRKRKWTEVENNILKKKFKVYLSGKGVHLPGTEIKDIMGQLNNRTMAQIRVKLNNMRLGKSK